MLGIKFRESFKKPVRNTNYYNLQWNVFKI